MMASLSTGTLKQYDVALKMWWHYCTMEKVAIFKAEIPNVISFLTQQLNKGASYGTLNSYRSAISLIAYSDLGNDNRMKRFFRGISKMRPQKPKYKVTWDPGVVLTFLSSLHPNNDLSLEYLSIKVVTLLALITAQRVQTLSKITLSNIISLNDKIQIKIPDILKTSARNKPQPCLLIPWFKENPAICVASTLQRYMEVTKN